MNYICLYNCYGGYLSAYTDAQVGRLIRAMLRYANTGEIAEFKGPERYLWSYMRLQMDRDAANYAAKCERMRQIGAKGGRARKRAAEAGADQPCEEADASVCLPAEANDAYNQNEKKNINKNMILKEKEEKETEDPAGARAREGSVSPGNSELAASKEADFERFWAVYPRHAAKKAAKEAFLSVDKPVDFLLKAVENQKRGEVWQREHGRYIPNPATWLREGRWDDEPAEELDPRKAIPKFADYLIGLEEYA